MESMQTGSMKTCGAIATTPRAACPAPAWMRAIDAPSECPTRMASSIPSRWRSSGSAECLVVHEAHVAARLGEHLGLAVTVAVVDERLAAGGGGRLHRKVAPLPDRAQ